jgi:predicted methyltransferase
MSLIKVFASVFLLLPCMLEAEELSPTELKIQAALDHERRTEQDIARDDNRAPLETLRFLRLQEDMSVLELLPGRGWYTKILAPVLEENRQALCISRHQQYCHSH